MRSCASGLMLGSTTGIDVPCAREDWPMVACRRCWMVFWLGCSTTSSIVFHEPQSGHLPTHLLCSPPHCWQTYFVRIFGMKCVPIRPDDARVKKESYVSILAEVAISGNELIHAGYPSLDWQRPPADEYKASPLQLSPEGWRTTCICIS